MKRKKNGTAAPPHPTPPAAAPRWALWFVWGVLGAGVLLALSALGTTAGRVQDAARFAAEGWGRHGVTIVDNKIRALWHAAAMTLAAGGGLWLLLASHRPAIRRAVGWALVLIVAFDAWWLSRHYVKTMPMSALNENEVVRILKQAMPERRVALVSQDGFYNWWLTYLFPYHGIASVNFTQMPRMPTDYRNFLGAVGRQPLRYWQQAAVGYVLAPVEAWAHMRQTPPWNTAFEPALAYRVGPGPEGHGVTVLPAAPGQPPQHMILRMKAPAPRYALIGAWRAAPDDEALRLLADPAVPLFEETLVAPEFADGLPAPGARGAAGEARLLEYRSGRVKLEVRADRPALLRAADKFDPDWTASIDGRPARVLRVDYICQGVAIPAGRHTVELRYAPSTWPLYVQGVGMLLAFGAAGWLVIERLRRRRRGEPGVVPAANAAATSPT